MKLCFVIALALGPDGHMTYDTDVYRYYDCRCWRRTYHLFFSNMHYSRHTVLCCGVWSVCRVVNDCLCLSAKCYSALQCVNRSYQNLIPRYYCIGWTCSRDQIWDVWIARQNSWMGRVKMGLVESLS